VPVSFRPEQAKIGRFRGKTRPLAAGNHLGERLGERFGGRFGGSRTVPQGSFAGREKLRRVAFPEKPAAVTIETRGRACYSPRFAASAFFPCRPSR